MSEIIHGDCLAVLRTWPDDVVDVTITSPTYNTLPARHAPSGLHGERRSGVNKWQMKAVNGYADQRDEGEYQHWLHEVIAECLRVSRGLVWVNHKVRYRNGYAVHPVRFLDFPIYSEVIWDRGGSMALNCKRYAPSHETIIGFGNRHYWNDEGNTLMSVWRIPPQRSTDHPCPFPLEIPRRLIRSSCPPGGTVLDPFCGSATTGMACLELDRKFVGIELEEKYCELSRQRLEGFTGSLIEW